MMVVFATDAQGTRILGRSVGTNQTCWISVAHKGMLVRAVSCPPSRLPDIYSFSFSLSSKQTQTAAIIAQSTPGATVTKY